MEVEDFWNGGVAAFESEDWSKAIEYFTRMIEMNAAHPSVPDARLYKARAHEAQEDFLLAIDEYQIFLDVYFSNPRAPEASLGICRSFVELSPIPQRDQSDTQRARDACGRTAIEFQGLTVAVEAEAYRMKMMERLAERAYQNAEFYRRRGQLLSAVDMFDEVATTHWDTTWAPAAILARHRIYGELGWAEEGEEEALRLEYNYPESPEAQLLREEGAATVTGAAAP
jgi:outer membrane protein assembly factor BamD